MKTLLLIEDNEALRENTAEILELARYRVITAENGKVGVEKALQTRPDLVICDVMMPELDGYGVLHIFSKTPQLARVPFIFLTAKADRADVRKGMELGADDYLTKPFDDTELLTAIESRLRRFEPWTTDYDLTRDGLHDFLDEARSVGGLHALSADRKPHLIRKKQLIYSEGDEPTRLYFLKAGKVKTARANADGKEFITGLYGPGEFFGFLSLLENTDYADSAVAMDDSEVLYIPRTDFDALLLRNPDVARTFVRLLAGRVAEREKQLLGMAYNSLRRRVADTLLDLYNRQTGEKTPIRLSRDDLASMVGTATESLIRTLSEYRQDGLIDIAPGGITLLHPEKLRRARW